MYRLVVMSTFILVFTLLLTYHASINAKTLTLTEPGPWMMPELSSVQDCKVLTPTEWDCTRDSLPKLGKTKLKAEIDGLAKYVLVPNVRHATCDNGLCHLPNGDLIGYAATDAMFFVALSPGHYFVLDDQGNARTWMLGSGPYGNQFKQWFVAVPKLK